MDLRTAARRLRLCGVNLAIAGTVTLGTAGATASAQTAPAPQIWFSPHGGHPPVPGAADYATLFQDSNPAWTAIVTKFQVFTTAMTHLRAASDSEAVQTYTNLHSHNVAVALVIEGVAALASDTCSHGEGWETPLSVQAFTARLQRLKLRPDIVVMDGPLWFGHYDPRFCQVPIPALVQRVATNLRFLTAAFPGLTYGETEPWVQIQDHASWQQDYAQLRDGIQVATGVKLAFSHSDTNPHLHPNWPSLVISAQAFVHQQGMQFGMIYDSVGRASSDVQWIADAKTAMDTLESQTHVIPDQAVIASWDPYPSHVLPATNPTTLSSLLLYYLSLPHTP